MYTPVLGVWRAQIVAAGIWDGTEVLHRAQICALRGDLKAAKAKQSQTHVWSGMLSTRLVLIIEVCPTRLELNSYIDTSW